MVGNLKITRGSAKGKTLHLPNKDITRPTTNKIRQAVINALQFELQDATVLDLFAGSGAVGIEFLSAGAATCDFVDSATSDIVRKNLAATGFDSHVFNLDYKRFLDLYAKEYDIIFLDPPYQTNSLETSLSIIHKKDIAKNYIICETKNDDLQHEFYQKDKKKYGDKFIYILTKEKSE